MVRSTKALRKEFNFYRDIAQNRLFVASNNSFPHLITPNRTKTLTPSMPIRAHSIPIMFVHFNWDGSLIVSTNHDGTCKFWDSPKATLVKRLIDDKFPIMSFAKFSLNGKFILVASLKVVTLKAFWCSNLWWQAVIKGTKDQFCAKSLLKLNSKERNL